MQFEIAQNRVLIINDLHKQKNANSSFLAACWIVQASGLEAALINSCTVQAWSVSFDACAGVGLVVVRAE
jgi:hypothetical protein